MKPSPLIRQPMLALASLLSSFEALRNGRALYLLLGTFATTGLLLAMAETALARDNRIMAGLEAGLAFFAAFYGSNAAGWLLMDDALGKPARDVLDALRDALFHAHRALAVLLVAGSLLLGLLLLASALLWATRAAVLGPVFGPILFGLTLPFAVLVIGLGALTLVSVVAPLAGPALWAGLGTRETLVLLAAHIRYRLFAVAVLMAAATLLTTATAGVMAFAVFSGARVVAVLAVLVTGIELPPEQLMAGFFGHGLRSLGAAGAPVVQSPYGAAALVGGGVVFALALVLPGLVYLRASCAVFLSTRNLQPAH